MAQYLTIALSGVVIESAVIQSAITDQGDISDSAMSLADANALAALLRVASVLLDLVLVSQQSR